MNRKLKRNVPLDYLSIFITNLNMQGSIWVLYLAFRGMSLMQIGLLEGIFHATSILCEVPSGALADLVGRRKSMLLSRLCITVSCIVMLFSKSFWLFALSFVIQALGYNLNSGSEEALVYDSMKALDNESGYLKVSGRINMLIEVSQAIATVAGGVLAEYSYFWCYVACTVISLLAFVPVLFMTEPPREAHEHTNTVLKLISSHFSESFRILTGDLRILKTVTFFSVVFAAHTLLFFYSQQYFYDLGYNKIQISIIMLFAGLISCAGALSSESLYVRLGDKVNTLSALFIAATMICYGFKIPMLAIVIFIASNFFNALLYPIESNTLNKLIPSNQRATLISVNSMFFSVVMILTFPLAGGLADLLTLPTVLMVLGVLLAAFSLIRCRPRKGFDR